MKALFHLPTLTVIAAVSACASTGSKWSDTQKIDKGMTVDEVVKLLGKPNSSADAGNIRIFVWVFLHGASGTSRTLRVDFQDGKVIFTQRISATL